MIIQIIGLKRLIDKFEQVGANFDKAATSALSVWLKMVERIIKKDKLSGQVLNVGRGQNGTPGGMLRSSIRTGVMGGAENIMGYITAGTPYAAIHEFGGDIHIPEIYPKKQGGTLRFWVNGKIVFAKYARAHTIKMPERSYIRSTLEEEKEGLLQSLLYESFTKHFGGGQK